MKLGSIAGSVTTSGVENWIELQNFRWGFAANTTYSQAGAEVTVREVVVALKAEKASPLIVNAGLSRTVLAPTVSFKFTTTTKDKMVTYLAYDLAGCVITNYSVDGTPEGRPTETLSLNFTKITETYTSMDPTMTGQPTSVTYDVKAAKSS